MQTERCASAKGRGSSVNPPNRFERVRVEDDHEHLAPGCDDESPVRSPRTEFMPDGSKSIVTENDSPDVGFRFSVNPYRGCEHGCAYCYARPTHEYLGFSAGRDFESKILVKHRAPELLREWLSRDSWRPETIAFSGVTDCYQPAERRYRLTRACLQVALEARQPISIVTKNSLVVRDVDVLRHMAALGIARVSLSINTLDESLAREMEPRTSPPSARLRTIRELDSAGIPVSVMLAPVIPGLNDSEIPAVLEAAAGAGAGSAAYTLLRVPPSVQPVFLDWLSRTQPTHKSRVESLIRSTRSGKLDDAQFGIRMSGCGPLAEQIRQTFRVFARKHGLDGKPRPLDTSQFRPPRPLSGQLRLF